MHVLIAIAVGVAIVMYAARGVPRRTAVVRATVAVLTFCAIGYVWLLVLFGLVARLERVFDAVPEGYPRAVFALLLWYAPPTLIALAAVRLVPRGSR